MNNIYNLNELTEEEKNKYNLDEITNTTEDKKEAPNYSSLMPGNTDYVNDDKNNFNPGEALNKVGSFFTGLFSPDENKSSIKSQYDSYQETKDIDTISGAAPDYVPVSNEPALKAEDIQNVNQKVGKVAGNVLKTVAGSGASLGSGVANSLDMLVDLSFQEDKQTVFEDYGESSQQFAKEQFEAGAWEDNLNVMESVKQGNIGEAISKSVQGALQNSAQLLTITGMGILGGGAAAGAGAGQALSATSGYLSGLGAAATSQAPLALITASAAGSKYAGLEDREDLSINQKVSSGLLSGGLEAATETWGSLRYLNEISNSVPGVDKTIRSEVMRYARALIDPKKLAANGITEAKEEYITEFGDALFDSMLGISDKTLPEVLADQEPYLNSAAIGFTSGLGMSGAAQLSNINQVSQMNEDINNRQQKADQFMNYVEQSNFNLQEDTKQALWEEAVNINRPSDMYRMFQNAEESIKNNDTITFEEGSKILDEMMVDRGDLSTLETTLNEEETTEQPTEEVEEQTEETTNVSNPLEVSDEDVSLEEPAESNQYSDLNTEELLRVREGLLREFEVTQNPDAYQEARTIERILDEQGVEYGEQETTVEEPTTEENAAEQTEPQQIEQEDTQEVEEPTEVEEVIETQPQQSDVELTEEELMEPQGQNAVQDNVQELSVEEIEDKIDDLFFELEEADTETEQIEIREQIDNLERELNTKVDEQQTTEEQSVDTEPNTAIHYGDLGKSESLLSMESSRGTGHFGTGTYFLGSEKSAGAVGYAEDRPSYKVDFNEYNLYEPETAQEGMELHDFLRDLNRYAFQGEFATDEMSLSESRYKPYQDELFEAKDKLFPDMSDEEFMRELNDLRGYVQAHEGLSTDEQSQLDSPSTRFMKTLGYEGIDVRNFDRLDTTEFGSVIYDLKDESVIESPETATEQETTEEELSEEEMVETKPYEDRDIIKSMEQAKEENVSVIPERKHLCQQCAYDNLMQNDVGTLALGTVEGIGFDGNVKRVRHAWVEYEDSIYDPQFDRYFSKELYGEQLKPRGERAFSKQEAKDEITINRITPEEVKAEIENQTLDTTETETADTLNLNSATIDDLTEIKGIGASTAQNIIKYRDSKENGIESVDELKEVKGIGSATFDKIAPSFTAEQVDTTNSTETIEEPTDSDIETDEDVEKEAKNLDVDDVIKDVEKEEGTTRQTNELLSEEARDLMEFEDTDIREYLDVVLRTSLNDLQNVTQAERDNIIDEIEMDDPDIAEAIRSELEERAYETDDYYYKKTDNAKNKDDIKNEADANDTDGNFEGVNKATRRDIENTIRVDLGLPLRYGKLQSRDSEAQYDRIYKVVRTRDYSNMEVTAHEVGHHLSDMLDLDVEAFPELVQLLEDEGLKDAYDKSVWHEEGNSEFFKYYFNYPGQAKIKVPAYYDYVESVLQGSDLYEPVKQLQNQMNTWNKQSYADRVSGAMSRQDLDIAPLMTMKDKLNEALVDEDVVFKRALEQAGYDVETLETYKNPWKLKRLYSSVNDMVDVFLSKKSLDPQGRPNGKSLLEILSPVQDYIGETEGREFGDFEVYSLALHALEREAKFLARDLEARGNDKGKLAAKRLNAVIDNANIEALIQSLKMADNNPDNLRSLGLELPEGEYRFRATGININDIANTVNEYDSKLFRDTLKDLQEYQNNLVDYAQYYDMLSEDAAEDIKTAYNFHMPLHRYFGEELINEGQDTSRYTDLPDVVKSAYGSTRIIKDPIRTLVRDTSYVVRQANKNNIVVKFMEALDAKRDSGIGNLVGREITTPEPIDKENVVSYRVDGEIKARVVHPDIYRTLQGLNKESEHVLRTMLKPLEYSNNLFKKFAVINPKFWLNNLGRDEVRQMIYEDSNGIEKLKLFSTMVDGMSEAFGLEKADTEAIFRGLGGARGGFAQYLKDMDNPQTLEELLRADKASKNPLDWLGDVAQWTEDTRRKGLFINKVGRDTDVMSMEAEEAERVLKEAAYFGKGEVLEDYSIKGRYTKELDRYAAPFSAAGMTGGRHLYNKLKQPSTWVNGIINVTIPSLAFWGMNRDKPEYQELPAWKKMLYFNYVKDNGEIISFPKPFITGYFFGAIPEMLAQVAYNKNGNELTDNLKTLIQAGAPNYQMAGGIAAGYEVLTNRADPLGDDYQIVPDSEKYLDNEDQYGEYNSEISKMLGSAINVSPRIIDHLLEGQFTGTYSMATNITDYVLGAKDFKEAVLGIVGVYSDPFITSTTVNKLYKDREKYNNLMSRLREKDMLKQEKGLNINEIREVATKYSKLNNITDTMSKYRKVSDIIDTLDIDPELKENANKYIDIQNINFAREYYDRTKIYLDDYMSQEEYQRVQELIDWIQRNY